MNPEVTDHIFLHLQTDQSKLHSRALCKPIGVHPVFAMCFVCHPRQQKQPIKNGILFKHEPPWTHCITSFVATQRRQSALPLALHSPHHHPMCTPFVSSPVGVPSRGVYWRREECGLLSSAPLCFLRRRLPVHAPSSTRCVCPAAVETGGWGVATTLWSLPRSGSRAGHCRLCASVRRLV